MGRNLLGVFVEIQDYLQSVIGTVLYLTTARVDFYWQTTSIDFEQKKFVQRWYQLVPPENAEARFRRCKFSWAESNALMGQNKEFFLFAFNSVHVKYGVWTWPYKRKKASEQLT